MVSIIERIDLGVAGNLMGVLISLTAAKQTQNHFTKIHAETKNRVWEPYWMTEQRNKVLKKLFTLYVNGKLKLQLAEIYVK